MPIENKTVQSSANLSRFLSAAETAAVAVADATFCQGSFSYQSLSALALPLISHRP